MKKAQGSTLIEMMVALTLGLSLLIIVIQIETARRASEEWQTALYQLQVTAKEVAHRLSSEIRMAGYVGCASIRTVGEISAPDVLFNEEMALTGSDHHLRVVRVSYPSASVLKVINPTKQVYVDEAIDLTKESLLIIADCAHAERLVPENIKYRHELHHQEITLREGLHHAYLPHAEVAPLIIREYRIGKTKRHYPDGQVVYAVFSQGPFEKTQELVEGVDEMVVSYTVLHAGVWQELNSADIADWREVKAVTLKLRLVAPPFKKYINLEIPLQQRIDA